MRIALFEFPEPASRSVRIIESMSRMGHVVDVYTRSEAIDSPNCTHLRGVHGVNLISVEFGLENPFQTQLRHWLGVDRRIKPGKSYLSRRRAERINKSIDPLEVKVARAAYKLQTPISQQQQFSDVFRMQSAWLSFAKSIVANGADLVWCVDLNSLPGAVWASTALNVPLVYAPQESFCDLEYLADRQRVLWQEIATKFTPLAHAVVSVSDELAQVEKLENGARNVRVIHNMPDTSTEVSSIDIKSALGISALEKLAVVVGNVVSNRGVEIAIEGIARNPDWKLAVVGGGSDEYIAKLRNFAQSIGVAKRVFFTGAIPRTQLTAYLETADLNLIPALPTVGRNHELSMPNKLFDGLSAGLPVLAVSGMALAAFVEREKLGATYTGDDYDELAKKLDEAQNFGVAARTRRHEFVWLANDEIVGETIDVAIAQHAKDSEH